MLFFSKQFTGYSFISAWIGAWHVWRDQIERHLILIRLCRIGRDLYSTFITPWADQSAARTVEPDFHLPGCYNVQPPPPGPTKAQAFSDETLFFMFYSSPKDALQEVAAQELYVRVYALYWPI